MLKRSSWTQSTCSCPHSTALDTGVLFLSSTVSMQGCQHNSNQWLLPAHKNDVFFGLQWAPDMRQQAKENWRTDLQGVGWRETSNRKPHSKTVLSCKTWTTTETIPDQPSILFNQQRFLNRHRRFQFRTDGTSFSASKWAGVGQQVQKEFVHCTGPRLSRTVYFLDEVWWCFFRRTSVLACKKVHGIRDNNGGSWGLAGRTPDYGT